jgi:undecaprenyl-diphosphatase
LWPTVARAFDGIAVVLRRPAKLAMLLGGSILITLAYLTTLYFSVEAFGGGLAFATVGAVFLVGSAVAQAAPTPGGLGAMEAALIGGLVAAGLGNTVAVPAVFLYRLITFWLPILPGWLSFQWLQTRDYL